MSLQNFFSINLPYGMQKNSDGEWFVFNREFAPLGFNDYDNSIKVKLTGTADYDKLPIYTKYPKLTDEQLKKIVSKSTHINYDNEWKIKSIIFYKDSSDPSFNTKEWSNYIKILKELSKYTI